MSSRFNAKHDFCLNLYIYISLSSDYDEINLVHITLFRAKELPTICTLESKLFFIGENFTTPTNLTKFFGILRT